MTLSHPTLAEGGVVLEPLELRHVDALAAIAAASGEAFALTFVPTSLDEMRTYVARAMDEASRDETRAFAIRDRVSGHIVGSTRLAHLERWTWPTPRDRGGLPDAAEIGWTFLAPAAQGTGINTASKRLLLGLAFDDWGVRRVTFIADVRNTRSRRAIERLGAQLDGVLRSHFPAADGSIRDSASYSILEREWPAIRDRLDARIAG